MGESAVGGEDVFIRKSNEEGGRVGKLQRRWLWVWWASEFLHLIYDMKGSWQLLWRGGSAVAAVSCPALRTASSTGHALHASLPLPLPVHPSSIMSRQDRAITERHTKILRELVKRPENKTCSDCKHNGPSLPLQRPPAVPHSSPPHRSPLGLMEPVIPPLLYTLTPRRRR